MRRGAATSLLRWPLASARFCRPSPLRPLPAVQAGPARPLLARWLSTQPAADNGEGASSEEPPLPSLDDQPAVRYSTRADAFLLFESPVYSRMVNMIMQCGKKETARKHLWRTLVRIRDSGSDPQEVFYGALENVRPMMEMKYWRTGAVPFPLNPRRSQGMAMKWLVAAARGKKGAPKRGSFDQRLANELIAAYQNKGGAIQKKEQVHKEAIANQAAAHFRWRTAATSHPGAITVRSKRARRPSMFARVPPHARRLTPLLFFRVA